MSGAILPRSRTEAERESFTLDVDGKVARRVTDTNAQNKLDTLTNTVQSEFDSTQTLLLNEFNETQDNQDLQLAELEDINSNLTDGDQITRLKGSTDGTLIGNFEDGVKIVMQRSRVTGFDNTYSAAISGHTFAASPTDIFTIRGSNTKTIRILRVIFSSSKNTAANLGIVFLKRSTDNTGGTFTTLTNTPRDSLSPAASAEVRAYTANPAALGTLLGNVYATRYYFSSGTGLGFGEIGVDFEHDLGGPVILRGDNEIFSINLLGTGVTVAGNLCEIAVDWTEVDN